MGYKVKVVIPFGASIDGIRIRHYLVGTVVSVPEELNEREAKDREAKGHVVPVTQGAEKAPEAKAAKPKRKTTRKPKRTTAAAPEVTR